MQHHIKGFVIRQTKTLNGRRMILMFSDKYGKISAGTSVSEKSKSKSALALRPFTLGRYEIITKKHFYTIKSGDVINSYFDIGEDVDRFMNASYVLEFTDKIMPEEAPSKEMFELLSNYMSLIEGRKRGFETLTLAFLVKALQIAGITPEIKKCIQCGEENTPSYFDVKAAGIVCENCHENASNNSSDELRYSINFDIVKVLIFLLENDIKSMEKLDLDDEKRVILLKMLRDHAEYHLGIGKLKSEKIESINH